MAYVAEVAREREKLTAANHVLYLTVQKSWTANRQYRPTAFDGVVLSACHLRLTKQKRAAAHGTQDLAVALALACRQ